MDSSQLIVYSFKLKNYWYIPSNYKNIKRILTILNVDAYKNNYIELYWYWDTYIGVYTESEIMFDLTLT